ncbi:gamma-glutamyltransferase [Hydromonas duriensis]|uniref:Glutathione hydrolase proenzyme n=1 Tax=Hydromonas duriensis TaxID=1527608 RepID=A0A4R6YAM2_9BURK|nr:gamma-glutamyltransferase [Hydromonas duriensis]TDR32585.1 gamma-glutamyltransferase 1 [Hydromonas duriensis]
MFHTSFKKNVLSTTVALAALGLMHNAWAFDSASPEAASGFTKGKTSVSAKKFMAATANPLATDAAYEMLAKGGSAVDAAVAAQMVLGLTEPQSSGIGGGAFLLTFDGHHVTNYDGRETSPKSATEKLFQTDAGADMAFYDAVVGGRSVGVPGAVAMLELAHKREGKLPWATLFEPAIRLATKGFAISPRLNTLLKSEKYLNKDEAAKAYFYQADGVTPKEVGTVLTNPEYAAVLKVIAQKGSKGLLTGEVAKAIVDKVNSHPTNPGKLTLADMAAYKPKIRQAVCGDYRNYKICGPAAPSSGGVAVLQMLGALERFNLKAIKPDSVQAVHYFAEAGRLAFADRGKYLADPDFVRVPTAGLINKNYLATRSALISEDKTLGTASAGEPAGAKVAQIDSGSPELPSTSHISIVDAQGHAVSMTTSIEDQFGSRQFVKGFLLNNQLTDFSFADKDKNGLVANRVEAGKRPRSSMAPVLVFDKTGKKLEMVVGSPGGSLIIGYVAQTLTNLIDWKMDPQTAVNAPHYGSRNGPKTQVEKGTALAGLIPELKAKGHDAVEAEMVSGLSAIVKTQNGYLGGGDARREGTVRGE